jgi:hypothetical protein
VRGRRPPHRCKQGTPQTCSAAAISAGTRRAAECAQHHPDPPIIIKGKKTSTILPSPLVVVDGARFTEHCMFLTDNVIFECQDGLAFLYVKMDQRIFYLLRRPLSYFFSEILLISQETQRFFCDESIRNTHARSRISIYLVPPNAYRERLPPGLGHARQSRR